MGVARVCYVDNAERCSVSGICLLVLRVIASTEEKRPMLQLR